MSKSDTDKSKTNKIFDKGNPKQGNKGQGKNKGKVPVPPKGGKKK
jgi:hypothetical protein